MNAFHDARAAATDHRFAYEMDGSWFVACDQCRGAKRVEDQKQAEFAAGSHICKVDRVRT